MSKWWILLVGIVIAECTAVAQPTPALQIVVTEMVEGERPSIIPTQIFISPTTEPNTTTTATLCLHFSYFA